MLRRRKDALTQLKGKHRRLLSQVMNPEQREQYDAALTRGEPALARLGKLRILLERFKLAHTLHRVQELDVEDKVIIFCEFKDSVFTLRDECQRLGIEAVTLGQSVVFAAFEVLAAALGRKLALLQQSMSWAA